MPIVDLEKRKEYNRKQYEKNREQRLLKEKIRREKYPEKVKEQKRKGHLKNTFSISIDEWNEMFSLQNGCCDICKLHASSFTKRLAVDHCHTTGKIRGLLCESCNLGLGKFKDNIEVLENAINYLNKNKD